MSNTFTKLLTSGSRYQRRFAGESILHKPSGGADQELTGLVHSISSSDRDINGTRATITSASLQLVQDELLSPVTRQSKFEMRNVRYNVDEQAPFFRHGVYIDIPVWTPGHVRKGEENYRNSLP